MSLRSRLSYFAWLLALFPLFPAVSGAQTLTPVCQPKVTGPVVVATHDQIIAAGKKTEPPLVNTKGFGFAWPDTEMGVIRTGFGYEFFASDGAFHPRQLWQGQWVGSNNYGSVTTTFGTLDNPLGTADPQDVTISPNPDPGVNPNYPSYGYIGGGPVFQVPPGMTGAGNLIVGYHAELPTNTLYAVHGLAASWDNGLHWADLGEVVRPNQSLAPELYPGFDPMGAGSFVLRPTGSTSTSIFPIGRPELLTRPICRWRGRPSSRCWKRPSHHRFHTPCRLKSFTREAGICSPEWAERLPISIPRRSTGAISMSITTSRSSAM